MVVTRFPAAALSGVTQLRMASPFRWTVQAPQSPMPQPNLAPVRSSSSRRYHSSGTSPAPSNLRGFPFTVSSIIQLLTLYPQRGVRGAASGELGLVIEGEAQ